MDALFTGRNWLGFTRKRSPLSFHRVVDILHKNSAPTQVREGRRDGSDRGEKWRGGADKPLLFCNWQVLQDYVALVDDAELRIALAQKHKCHDIVINVRTLGVCFNLLDWLTLTEGFFFVHASSGPIRHTET